MDLYIKVDSTGMLVESCLFELAKSTKIKVTQEEYDNITAKYDTQITNNKIVSQVKGDEALALEEAHKLLVA